MFELHAQNFLNRSQTAHICFVTVLVVICLTHPDFAKLAGSQLFHHLKRIPWDLPLVLGPGLLRVRRLAGVPQALAQPIRAS